jgi:hypothetical protein
MVPPRTLKKALKLPRVRKDLITFSCEEYDENTYYASLLEKIAVHTLGPCPILQSNEPNEELNYLIEDKFSTWTRKNGIGKALRELRIEAAKTGFGIGIPYTMKNTDDPVKLGFRVYGADVLMTPKEENRNPLIVDGVEYDSKTHEIVSLFLCGDSQNEKPTQVKIQDCLFFGQMFYKGIQVPIPECVQAFSVYPSIRRYLISIIKAEEFKESIPMAVEVDPQIYGPLLGSDGQKRVPSGTLDYVPGSVYTLPPGTKLTGIPRSESAADRSHLLKTLVGAAAVVKHVPENLAFGSSANSNMASSQVDMQPWELQVLTERYDFSCVLDNVYNKWYELGRKTNNYIPNINTIAPTYIYSSLFHHPDPLKRSKSTETDLISGATTLTEYYASRGKNAKRILSKEAAMLGITVEELYKLILANRGSKLYDFYEEKENSK